MWYDSIPKELQELPQWVCAYEGTKVPMNPYRWEAASTTDPSTWGTFSQAVFAVEQGYYDYIGFVFADNGIIGIDIDKGYDEDGLFSAEAVDIVGCCRSYTEKSRSGRGMHIFLRGTLPFDGANNRKGVEIYRTGRYFICTGHKMIFGSIIENQEAINRVVAEYFSDCEKCPSETFEDKPRIYTPVWAKPSKKGVKIAPEYPLIEQGCRNVSLLSLGGSLVSVGYPKKRIYEELLKVNEMCCRPPLSVREVQTVTDSVWKYRR